MAGSRVSEIDRAWRILALALLFFGAGVAFFFLHGQGSTDSSVVEARESDVQQNPNARFANFPAPSTYTSFTYTGAAVDVSGTCTDAFYTVLIYPSSVDYRKDHAAARYNVAHACPTSHTFAERLTLSSPPFVQGEKYYIVRAQQGKTNEWYTPY